MSRHIVTQIADDGVATLTLSRPERRNALSIELRNEITERLDSWATDPAIRAVVLTGAGSNLLRGLRPRRVRESRSCVAHSGQLASLSPGGVALPQAAGGRQQRAGGMDLCVLCDFRTASASAVFGHPEIKFGAPPLFTPLQWIVGMGIARGLCLTGRRIDAHEALRIGLVNSISEPARVPDDALAMARTIIEAPQAALECTKRYLTSSPSVTFEQALRRRARRCFRRVLARCGGPERDQPGSPLLVAATDPS